MAIRTFELKQAGLALGFQSIGVSSSLPPVSLPLYADWLDHGHHGSMGYLKESLPLRSDPQTLLPGARSVVAVTLNYNQPNPERPGQPKIARYALGRDYHKVMRGKLKRLSAWMDANLPSGRHRACVDSAPILEREYAHLAGLGWYGKNTCLIDTRKGSWFFIGLLLTTLDLEFDAPELGSCGTCSRCVAACPTECIVFEDGRWQIAAERCISYLTIEHRGAIRQELRSKIGGWTFGCDVCQEVCPFNAPREHQPERARPTSEPDFLERRNWPSLVELASVSEPHWDHATRGSAVRRAGTNGLRRNAAINLENAQAREL